MRTCICCGIEKPDDAYYKRAEGIHHQCKDCIKKKNNLRYKKNRKQINTKRQKLYKENSELQNAAKARARKRRQEKPRSDIESKKKWNFYLKKAEKAKLNFSE